MKVLLLLLLPFAASSQGYFDAGYSGSVSHRKLNSGVYFGAGYDINSTSVGFIVDCLNLNYKEDFAVAAADFRYNYRKLFVSVQPGKVLYENSKYEIKGTWSYAGMAGVKFSLFTFSAGYQNMGFKYSGVKIRSGTFKAAVGIRLN